MGDRKTNHESSQSAAEPSSTATSKKTLSDIEETQKDSGPAGGDRSSPSPDGEFAKRERLKDEG